MTHTAAAERVAAMTRYHAAWNVLLAAYADLVETTGDPVLRQRHADILASFVAFREAQMDYYAWMGLTVMDIQATVNEIKAMVRARHPEAG